MFRLLLISAVIVLMGPPAASAQGKPCHPFDGLALEKLPTRLDPDSPDRMQDIWTKWSNDSRVQHWPLTTTTDPQFRIETSVSALVPHPRAYEVRGVRTKGRWRLQARSMAITHRADRWEHWREVPVTQNTASVLDTLMEQSCLWSAPSFLAAMLPLAAGGWVPSFDGPMTLFDVRAFGQTWAGLQVSWTLGTPAQLRKIAMVAAFGNSLDQLVPGDERLTSAGIHYKDEAGEHPWSDGQEVR